jgi:hypothetical protein
MKMNKLIVRIEFLWLLLTALATVSHAQQSEYWQQKVKYTMDAVLDIPNHRLNGNQKLEYWNNSPDTLCKLFYHLYWNAFRKGSMMSAGYQRINRLDSARMGYQKVKWIKLNGVIQNSREWETILEVQLSRPIPPGSKALLELAFDAQVPYEVGRRAGWDTISGLRFSMAQWYPKLCEYDVEGWHADPYCDNGEFYGIWGNFDVTIHIDKSYILGATGYLKNASEVGYGYEQPGTIVKRPPGSRLAWHFYAGDVHDFVWAADAHYRHLITRAPDGMTIHVLYSLSQRLYEKGYNKEFQTFGKFRQFLDSAWSGLAAAIAKIRPFSAKKFGPYPYAQFSILDGGDAGMEYPMATLANFDDMPILNYDAVLGVVFHEFMHQWYYGILGTNETEHPWMDEGFALYTGHVLYDKYENLRNKPTSSSITKAISGDIGGSYQTYFSGLGEEEPISTYSDYFSGGGYTHALFKGEIFLAQLGYIVGEDTRDKVLLEYYRQWRFKHPGPLDFMRVAEKVSGVQLGWYYMYWVDGTKTIDYGIDSVWEKDGRAKIRLRKIGDIPMPIDLLIQYNDGSQELIYIPQYLMFGLKPAEDQSIPRRIFEPWKFTDRNYIILLDKPVNAIKTMEIDPSRRMADIDRKNNLWPAFSK